MTPKTFLMACAVASLTLPSLGYAEDAELAALKERVTGTWTSISCEIRPTANPEGGAPKPTYLTRDFTYDDQNGFSAVISTYLDPACSVPLVEFSFAGDIDWHGPNPAAPGAYSQDYVLNKALQLTPKHAAFAENLNALPEGACGTGPFEVDVPVDVLGQPCILVTILEGETFVIDHDLLYVPEEASNMLFMGGKHVDGTGFYAPENRPTVGLQQPLIRVN